jgi:glutaredoxin 2
MEPTLYHYVHCPFCLRVRFTLGLLGIPYKSEVLSYDDEKTPLLLTGVKMLPILSWGDKTLNESLDIMVLLDQENRLDIKRQTTHQDFLSFEAYLNFLGGPIHSLAMPYWIFTPEFTSEARTYFQSKKEKKRGPFKEIVKERERFEQQLHAEFPQIIANLKPFYNSEQLGLYDILLASHLWGLYIVPEFQFPEAIHNWLQEVKRACNFNYHADFWK